MATSKQELDRLRKENETLEKAAAVLKAKEMEPASRARPLTADELTGSGLLPAQPRDADESGRWGFRHFGEFAREVQRSRANGGVPTDRIQKAYSHDTVKKAATGMGELVGSDGGFLVPPSFSDKIFDKVYVENNILSRTDQYTVTGNSMVFPRVNETSRATGSRFGGVRAYWVQEGGTITASRPTFGRLTLNLHKLACLAAVTEELIQDSGTALSNYLNRVFTSEISFLAGSAIVRGTGSGQPLGILNADCLVTVAAETGQTLAADPLNTQNVVKMWARLFRGGSDTSNAVWFVNQDVLPALYTMTLGIGTAGVATFMPPGGLSGKPYATLLGAPVIETEWNSTLGTTGDIILADMSQYVTISKGGMQAMSSMHLYFDTDQQAFRVTFRLDGSPWWPAALTPFQGTNTQSPFVTLATRS